MINKLCITFWKKKKSSWKISLSLPLIRYSFSVYNVNIWNKMKLSKLPFHNSIYSFFLRLIKFSSFTLNLFQLPYSNSDKFLCFSKIKSKKKKSTEKLLVSQAFRSKFFRISILSTYHKQCTLSHPSSFAKKYLFSVLFTVYKKRLNIFLW